jgi:hypothetical protein
MKNLFRFFLFISIVLFSISSCASVQVATVKSNSNYKKVWKACLDSLSDVRYSASSTDSASGLIIADQAVVSGHGTVSRLNINLSKESNGVVVVVKFVPPPGTIGGQGTADAYVEALKKRLPDLKTIVSN